MAVSHRAWTPLFFRYSTDDEAVPFPPIPSFASSNSALSPASRTIRRLDSELYSVREELQKDLMGTVRAVGKMGYQVVEFYAPYFAWKPDYAKEVRKTLDDSGLRCLSTHNGNAVFTDAEPSARHRAEPDPQGTKIASRWRAPGRSRLWMAGRRSPTV